MKNMEEVISRLPGTPSLKPFLPPTSKVNVGNAERLLSLIAAGTLVFITVKENKPLFLSLLMPTAYLLFRGITGYDPINAKLKRNTVKNEKDLSLTITQKETINKPVEEVYEFWKNFENLPKVMEHISEVIPVEGRTSRWSMKIPVTHIHLSWDAVMIEDVKNERITWRSVEGSEIMNSGEVRFRVINSERTEIQVILSYAPPMGYAGKAFAGLFNSWFSRMIRADIKRVKSFLETGTLQHKQ
jgi:uncharacterized membrane protein